MWKAVIDKQKRRTEKDVYLLDRDRRKRIRVIERGKVNRRGRIVNKQGKQSNAISTGQLSLEARF